MAPRPVPYRWLVFGLLAAGYFLVYFHRVSPAVVAVDMMRDLNAGGVLIGLLGSAFFYPYALMQISAGLLTDSWGPRRTIAAFFGLAGFASIFFGLAPSTGWAIFARVLVGTGIAMLFVPTIKVLSHWFRTSEFAMITGFLISVGGLGALSAAEPLARLSGLIGWRGSFMAIGLVTILLTIAIIIFVRNRPEDLGYPPAEAHPGAGEPAGPEAAIGLVRGIKLVLGRPAFWVLAVLFFSISGGYLGFGGLWGGPYLQQVYGMSKEEAGRVLNLLAVAIMAGSPMWCYLSDRMVRSRKKILVAASVLELLLTAVLAFIPDGMSRWMLYPFCFLFGLGSPAVASIAFAATKELFPSAISGTAVGLANFFAFLGASVVMPLVGWRLEAADGPGTTFTAAAYGQAFTITFICAVVALGASLGIKETFGTSPEGRRTERPPACAADSSRL